MDWKQFISPSALMAVSWLAFVPACKDDPGGSSLKRPDAGQDEVEDEEIDQSSDPGTVADAADGEDSDPELEETDAGVDEPVDSGPPEGSFWLDASNEAGVPIVIAPPADVTDALCKNNRDSVQLSYSDVTRGSWQLNPGGSAMMLPVPGYPCAAFLEERKSRPTPDDPGWTDAPDGLFVAFHENSTITDTDYMRGQFRYFRSFVYVPSGANLRALTVTATGIDDSVYLELSNSRYPMGISPQDAGPADPMVGACQGNGMGEWNLARYMVEGEINVILLVHADLAAATSTLTSVDIRADGMPIQLVSCKR